MASSPSKCRPKIDASDFALRPGFLALLEAFVAESRQRAAPRRGDVGVVHEPEMVLERGHPRDQRSGVVPQGFAHELERVAQPLARDPELVQRLDIGPAQDGLVPPDVLVGRPHA